MGLKSETNISSDKLLWISWDVEIPVHVEIDELSTK